MKDDYFIIDQLLKEIDLEDVPTYFITAAKIEYTDGTIKLVSNSDLTKITKNSLTYDEQGISEIRLWINIDLIKNKVDSIVQHILTTAKKNIKEGR